jgi:Uma2 family endonuclease
MTLPAGKPIAATYADILALPEHVVGEIIDGELYVSPRPASPHAVASSVLGEELGPPFKRGRGGPGGWIILDEPELHIGGQVMVPDLAGWRRERMPVIPDVPFFELAPDWVCEVISPRTGRLDRAKKMPKYARWGVTNVWLVDPIQQTVEIYRLNRPADAAAPDVFAGWTLVATHSGEEKVRAEPFDAIELELALLWAR